MGLCLLIPYFGISQHTIEGEVVNENNEPLGFATVALLNPEDSTLQFFGVTDAEGSYIITGIKESSYLLQYSYVGMKTTFEKIAIPVERGTDLGTKILLAKQIEEVIVEAEMVPIKFKSDTLEFNAQSFKTRPGAAVEELSEKLPGVEVDEAGNIKAQGENVVQVLVEGKEFFGKDPKVATKNLPAKALDKVQVYDAKSEEAVYTGVDDGVRRKTLNLLLNEEHKKGYFGRILAREEGTINDMGEKEPFRIPVFTTTESFIQPMLSMQLLGNQLRLRFALESRFNRFEKELEGDLSDDPGYFYFLPQFDFWSKYRSGREIEVSYRSSVNMPNANQLFPIQNAFNQIAVYQGTFDLKPEYRHDLRARWSLFDQFSFTSLFVNLGGTYIADKISVAQSVGKDLVQLTTPVNVQDD